MTINWFHSVRTGDVKMFFNVRFNVLYHLIPIHIYHHSKWDNNTIWSCLPNHQNWLFDHPPSNNHPTSYSTQNVWVYNEDGTPVHIYLSQHMTLTELTKQYRLLLLLWILYRCNLLWIITIRLTRSWVTVAGHFIHGVEFPVSNNREKIARTSYSYFLVLSLIK